MRNGQYNLPYKNQFLYRKAPAFLIQFSQAFIQFEKQIKSSLHELVQASRNKVHSLIVGALSLGSSK
jgi:hypothetical protein